MRVGIYTHYAYCDQAYYVVRLVDFLRNCGVEFSIYSDVPPGKLGIAYDAAVTHRGNIKFTDWAKKQNAVIWTLPPKLEQLKYVDKLGALTVIVPMWQELLPPFKKVFRAADKIVSACVESQELFRDVYKTKGAVLVPYDPGLPLTRKEQSTDARQVKIFLPWFDRNAKCANSDFLSSISYLFERMPDARLTVGIMSSRFSPNIAKFFATLNGRTNGRVTVLRNKQFTQRSAIYGLHDITLFPAECDNYGFCGLTSVNCGTPVVSFALSPQIDYIFPNENGVLVRTKTDYDENGVPHAVPDYTLMMQVLQVLIAEPAHIDAMNKKVSYNIFARRKSFDANWKHILGID